MTKTFLFDLDMTLVDTSALASLRKTQQWERVRQNMHLVRTFKTSGSVTPHELPLALSEAGHRVGIVTSSPRWYAQQVAEMARIKYDVLVAYDDTDSHKPDPEPILHALKLLGVQPGPDVVYVGDDVIDIEASYHAGVTSVGVRWSPTALFEFSSAAPDIFLGRPSTLIKTHDLNRLAYIGECYASSVKVFEHWGSVLACDDESEVYALGRYMTASDPRHAHSRLSAAILALKNDDGPADMLGEALGTAIAALDWTPEYVVPVPPKPSQMRKRFQRVLEVAARFLPEETEVVLDGLGCVKEVENYKAMGPIERKEAIKGAFASNYTWGRSKVLLIDDVYTTGETISECANVLRGTGASEVRTMVIGKDQRTFARKTCPACGRSMKVRTSGKGVKFWGCSGYPSACQNTENM